MTGGGAMVGSVPIAAAGAITGAGSVIAAAAGYW
jgi:hypothetical protein